jgi:hypothetical protein
VNALVDSRVAEFSDKYKAYLFCGFPVSDLGISSVFFDASGNRIVVSRWHGKSLHQLLLTSNFTERWTSTEDSTLRQNFKEDVCDVVYKLLCKYICHCDIRPANICVNSKDRFQLIDWDCMSTTNPPRGPIGKEVAKKDGRYPCAVKSQVLLTMGQLILVVFIIEKGKQQQQDW